MSYKHGVAGCVKLGKTKAQKYMLCDEMYWLREYSAYLRLRMFNHPNIIQYISGEYSNETILRDSEEIPGMYFSLIFPKYVKTLDDIRIHSDHEFIQIVADLLSAVALLHKQNIIHRDIKCENVLVNRYMRAILIDFSHSIRIRSPNTVLDTAVVTYTYRAPEVFRYARGKTVGYTKKIDIWSIGVIMFELVTHRNLYGLLFGEENEAQVEEFLMTPSYLQRIKEAYFRHKKLLFWAEEYWNWIVACLTYQATDRRSAEELLATVQSFAKTHDIRLASNAVMEPDLGARHLPVSNHTVHTQRVCNAIEKYMLRYSFTAPSDTIAALVSDINAERQITEETEWTTAMALFIIILTSVYDYVERIHSTISFLCKPGTVYHSTIADVREEIIRIVQLHEKDLFVYDTYNFGVKMSQDKQQAPSEAPVV